MIDEDEFATACTTRGGPEGAGEGKEDSNFFVSQTSNLKDGDSSHFQTESELSNFSRCLGFRILYNFVYLFSPFFSLTEI